MLHLWLVFVGGGAGSVARYAVTKLISDRWSTALPLGTLGVNVIGCFLIGIIYAALQKYSTGNQIEIKLLLITGFCGGFTTFSTFAYENSQLWLQGSNFLALAYILGSLGLSLTATFIGISLVTK
jgi:fluoride exporter